MRCRGRRWRSFQLEISGRRVSYSLLGVHLRWICPFLTQLPAGSACFIFGLDNCELSMCAFVGDCHACRHLIIIHRYRRGDIHFHLLSVWFFAFLLCVFVCVRVYVFRFVSPLAHLCRPTRILAIDCEMVGVRGAEPDEERSVIARVSLVNFAGRVVYDHYVRPEEPVVNYRTAISGIRPEHLSGPQAIPFAQCTKEVADLLRNRVLVGHAVHHDLKALMLSHPGQDLRDTARYRPFCPAGPKSLKKLCKEILGLDIQDGQHDSVRLSSDGCVV